MVNDPVGCFLSTDTIGGEQEDQDKWKFVQVRIHIR
jgi:hypothetical protein